MEVPICRHIRTNGIQCRAPKLHDGAYCFFHKRLYARHSPFRNPPATHGVLIPGHHIQLEPLEDSESVQIALSVVINALATGQLETKRATALLYGLQLASMNAVNLNFDPYAPKVVRSAESLPDGLDLAAPGATVDLTEDNVRAYDRVDDDDDDADEDDDDDDDEEDVEEYEENQHETPVSLEREEPRLPRPPLRPPINPRAPTDFSILPSVFWSNPELAPKPLVALPGTPSPISLERGKTADIPFDSVHNQE